MRVDPNITPPELELTQIYQTRINIQVIQVDPNMTPESPNPYPKFGSGLCRRVESRLPGLHMSVISLCLIKTIVHLILNSTLYVFK